MNRPWYQSKKFLAFAYVGLLYVVSIILAADVVVQSILVGAIASGLNMLLHQQGKIDTVHAQNGHPKPEPSGDQQ